MEVLAAVVVVATEPEAAVLLRQIRALTVVAVLEHPA
jgi:hypothetical protein